MAQRYAVVFTDTQGYLPIRLGLLKLKLQHGRKNYHKINNEVSIQPINGM